MAVVSYWTNADGLRVRFGAHDSQNSRLGASVSGENVKTVVAEFVYNDLPAPGGAGVLDQVYLPAGAYVISTTFQVDTAFAGGTSLQVGTEQADGTDIDLDGFHTDAQLVTASMTAGAVFAGTGADIGTVVDGTYDSFLKVTATGTFTAGSARVIIDYLPKFDY